MNQFIMSLSSVFFRGFIITVSYEAMIYKIRMRCIYMFSLIFANPCTFRNALGNEDMENLGDMNGQIQSINRDIEDVDNCKL